MLDGLLAFFHSVLSPLQGTFRWVNIFEIGFIVSILYIFYRKFIRNTQSENLVKGLFFLVFAWVFSEILVLIDLKIIGLFFKTLVTLIALSLIVIFQPELRRFLGYLGQPGFIKRTFFQGGTYREASENDIDVIKEIIEAVKYFDDACKNLRGKFYLGGHSKGGNLALFSGTYCNIKNQKRILQIYNFDGPGFEEIVLKDERFLSIQKKIKNFVPKKSVVGILFDTGIEKAIVESSNNGIMQHDPLTWNVLGTNFVTTEELSKESIFIDKTLKTWLKQTDKDKRETFIEALFNVIESAEANNITEITENWFKSSAKIIHHLRNLDSDTKEIIFETIKIIFKSAQESVQEKIRK